MADQATLNGGPSAQIHSPLTEGVIGNLAEFGNDTITLVELQAKLLAHDFQEGLGKAIVSMVLATLGLLLLLGCVPIALAGLALLLMQVLEVSLGSSLLIVAGVSLVLAIILALIAVRGISRSLSSFDRSREELARNISWIKTVLVHSGRFAPKQKPQPGWSNFFRRY